MTPTTTSTTTMAAKMATAMRFPLSRMQQRRWARVCDVRFVATAKGGIAGGSVGAHGAGAATITDDGTTTTTTTTTAATATGGVGAGAGGAFNASVLEKYRAKLHRKAKEHGFDDVTQLREAYKDKIDALRREQAAALAAGHSAAAAGPAGPAGAAGAVAAHAPQPTPSVPSLSPSPPPSPPPPSSSAQHQNVFTSPSSSSPSFSFPSTSLSPSSSTAGSGSSSAQPRLPQLPRSQAGPKPLSAYVDVPKLLELPARELEYVWRLRHASSPDSLCAVIPAATYARMAARARRHPQFILPLPRRTTRISSPPTPPPSPSDPAAAADAAGVSAAVDAASADEGIGAGVDGAEIHFLQWSFPTPTTSVVLFTHLAEYKLRGAFSQPHTTVTHHLDLLAPRGVVLLHGSVARGRGVGVDDGRWLLMCLQKFYGGVGGVGGNNGADALGSGGGDGNEASTSLPHDRLLEQFTSGAADFRLEELLDHAERIT